MTIFVNNINYKKTSRSPNMSKLNILGIIKNIRSKSNIYTPIVEAVVNSIDAIREAQRSDGQIDVIIKRNQTLNFDGALPSVRSLEIVDNGIGFTQKNRDSFDTYYSALKYDFGGKGFGRFMYLKYFNQMKVKSIFKEENKYHERSFRFGKQDEIVVDETVNEIEAKDTETHVYLNDILNADQLDKGIDTIARKLLEKLLIFFINEKFPCPKIIVKEEDDSSRVVLNDYLKQENNEISLVDTKSFELDNTQSGEKESFIAKVFKITYAQAQKSKICLTGHNREVTEVMLHTYIPEFEDDFYDVFKRGKDQVVTKNYIVKVYVLGDYLDENVSLERETFNFDKEKRDPLYPISQSDIEREAANIVKNLFDEEVKHREDAKVERIKQYITDAAPWHKAYMRDLQLDKIPFHASPEKIELEFQKIKFEKEQEARIALKSIIESEGVYNDDEVSNLAAKVTEAGKNDLTHYVCNRRIVLKLLQQLLKRDEAGKAQLEKELHNLIFPMGKDDSEIQYEEHNLWLLDERLVFSEYTASDRKIGSQSAGEPDLVVFDKKRSYRNGDNEFGNPLTVFEFKRPKRTTYTAEDDPIMQVGRYVDEIRAGKYETPEGQEKVKVNAATPVYGYIICDITDRIRDFARQHQLTLSPDEEGYFGYHNGYHIYFEIISYKRLLSNAELRNKIFFRKLNID
ncbi:ATP-binding protein [Alistipes timonensis]|jgi:hypothetical protein|nr:ATP-binding protein [Alistipes timonensis]